MEQGGILTGPEIKKCVEDGRIEISPYNEKFLNPGSYDVRLGRKVAVFRATTLGGLAPDPANPMPWGGISSQAVASGKYPRYLAGEKLTLFPTPQSICKFFDGGTPGGFLDSKEENPLDTYELKDGEGILLKPGIGYLMHTEERVKTDHFVPVLDGKSSLGRLFVTIHVTAGYGELGFDGQYTLEVMVQHPVVLYAGMRIGQIRFHTIVGEKQSYQDRGHYVKDKALGPVASQAHIQIKEDGI